MATDEPKKKEPPITVPRAIIVKRPAVRPFALFFIGFLACDFYIIISDNGKVIRNIENTIIKRLCCDRVVNK